MIFEGGLYLLVLHTSSGSELISRELGGRRRVKYDNPIISRRTAAAFMAPALVFILVFLAFPAVWAIYIGVTNLTLTGRAAIEPEVVGFANFTAILHDSFFRNSLWITIQFVLESALIGQMALGLSLAQVVFFFSAFYLAMPVSSFGAGG